MAYPSVISLKQTLHRILHSSQNSLNTSSSKRLLQSAYNQVTSLQQILNRFDNFSSDLLNSFEEQIRDEAHALEDFLEFHELNHFLTLTPSQDADDFNEAIKSFSATAEKITNICIAEIGPQPEEEEDNEKAVPSDHHRIWMDPYDYDDVKASLTERMRPNGFGVFQITGLPGCGATIAAATIFEDLKHCFDCRAWIRVGPRYESSALLLTILHQINDNHELILDGKGVEEIEEFIRVSLKDRKYLIVMDDIRSPEIWSSLEVLFPVQDNGSAVVFTTRGEEYELRGIRNSLLLYNMACRNQDSWWYLFSGAMFGPERCPYELVEAGKKIVANCKSLGIVVLKVILLLLKKEKTPEYWNQLAEDELNPVFMVGDEIYEIQRVQEELHSESYSFIDDDERGLLLDLIDISTHIENIKMEIFPKMFFPKMLTTSFLGMAGIGKTSLAKKIFEDPTIRRCFDHHLFVNLGPEYKSEEIVVDLLIQSQIYPNIDRNKIKEDEDLRESLCAELCDKKCLVVLDDLWSKKSLHYMKKSVPNIKGAILVTTRLSNVAQTGKGDIVYKMHLLNKEESWDLFCKRLFGDDIFPFQLEKAGKKIVENCEGLPLMIVTVADLLSRVEKTPQCWSDAARRDSPIFMDAYDQISKVLVPSYEHLPQYLKLCFLYIGMFPQNKVIPTSKLIILWTAEGFLEPDRGEAMEDYAAECLVELENRSLIMVSQKGSNFKVKTCSLHCVFWHLSNNVATKKKIFQALTTLADSKVEDMKGQRRFCIRNNTLLGINDVHDAIASMPATRSMLCIGPSHPYPVSVCFDLRLLRLMDALAIRLYEFPVEVVKSYYLRYLALTYNESLPPCISKLWNLQFLIVSRHSSIKSSSESTYLPMEIWDMEELKHLQIAGSNLPDPNKGIVLPNLATLLGVSAQSCTKKVLKSVPNLKRLGIQIELEPDEKGNPFRCLNRISGCLRGLESLKCVVVNPDFMSETVSPPAPRSMFPLGLKKLSLSGLGYPWEYMKIISKLENLEVLKLRCYAFQGPEWEMDDDDLLRVRFLLIEDTDLIRWKFSATCFISLKCLCIKHCYQLEELPRDLSTTIETIEVVDCNPFVGNWAKEYYEEDVTNFQSISSWDARNLK